MKAEEELIKLQKLVSKLSSAEIEVIKKLTASTRSNFNKVNKQKKLLFFLLNKQEVNYYEFKTLISKKSTDGSFNRVIYKLKSKILETLILDVNIDREETVNSAFKYKLKLKKMLVSAFVLHSRGMVDISLDIYDEVIKLSKRYELYDDLLEALYVKQGLVGLTKGLKEYEKISEEIIFYEDCRIGLYNAKDWYRAFYAEVDFKGLKGVDYIARLKKYINQLKVQYQRTRSANIYMYQFLLEMELFQQLKNFSKVDSVGNDFLYFVKRSEALYGKNRIGLIYLQLAENRFKTIDFEQVLNYCEEGLGFFVNKTLNYYLIRELQLEVLFYLNRIEELKNTIIKLSQLDFYSEFDYRRTKLRYFLGMGYFTLKDYKSAKVEFNDTKEIEKDKEGYNVWIRIMRIMCDIETEKYSLIDYDIENFRKYIERTSQRKDIRTRDSLILQSLISLERNQFDFSKTYKKEAALFERLASMEDHLRWKIDSPELILYHQWFLAKVNKVDYVANFEPYKAHVIVIEEQAQVLEAEVNIKQ